jgi:hypothetical protein
MYKGIIFPINHLEYDNPIEFAKIHRISIEIPRHLGLKDQCVYISYEVKLWDKYDCLQKHDACYRLAKQFVNDILPKIDYNINCQMHNDEVEKILEILD